MFENFDWIAAMRTSPVMVALIILSVLTLGFVIERAIYFNKRNGNPDAIMHAAMGKVRSGNRQEAQWALTTAAHPVGPVAAEVLASAGLPPEASEEQLVMALGRERLLLERNLGFLGTMGNTAPLIGLLGTVWGIMRAFHDMAATGSAGPSVVAAGVAEALFTTASGLLVAVPAVILYNYFLRRMHVMLTQAEHHARKLRITLLAESKPAHHRPAEMASA
jgi:biopolymer transport protein ExbB